MSETVTIAYSAVNAKLHEPSREAKLELQRILSYRVAGAEHASTFKMGKWDGRSSFFDFRAGTFPAGFVHFVGAKLKHKGYEVRHLARPLPAPLGPENPTVDSFPEDSRYDYQMETVRRLVRYGQIIAQCATGSGKSRIARLAFARINRPTLFLTTRGILMYQMKDAFERDLGIPCSVLGDGQFGYTDAAGKQFIKKMSVGMVQTLNSRLQETTVLHEYESLYTQMTDKQEKAVSALRKSLEKAGKPKSQIEREIGSLHTKQQKELKLAANALKAQAEKQYAKKTAIRAQTIELLAKFELVILEEAHEASGNGYFDILRHCKNAHYRLALTGTPFMKDDEEANMRLMASSGPIAIKVSEKMLIDRGILATPKFKIVRLKVRPDKLMKGTGWQSAYRLGIVENEERNQAICDEVGRAAKYGLSAMVLIQQKAHGVLLSQKLSDAGLRVAFIQGEDNQDERKEALRQLASKEIDVLIGTTILDVGVDVPAVGLIVLAGGGKAEVALRQRIGRGLRAKKSGPNIAFVIDFDDPFNSHTKTHAQQRHQIIADTEGFGENIVPVDFDYEALGFTKK